MGKNAQVDKAVAAAEAPESVQMLQIRVEFGEPGRFGILILPPDVTTSEALKLVGWITRDPKGTDGLWDALAAANQPKSRIATPGQPGFVAPPRTI